MVESSWDFVRRFEGIHCWLLLGVHIHEHLVLIAWRLLLYEIASSLVVFRDLENSFILRLDRRALENLSLERFGVLRSSLRGAFDPLLIFRLPRNHVWDSLFTILILINAHVIDCLSIWLMMSFASLARGKFCLLVGCFLEARCSELPKRILAGTLVEFELSGIVPVALCSAVIAFSLLDLVRKVRIQLLLSYGLHLGFNAILI